MTSAKCQYITAVPLSAPGAEAMKCAPPHFFLRGRGAGVLKIKRYAVEVMLKQADNQNSKCVLRQSTFSSYQNLSYTDFCVRQS